MSGKAIGQRRATLAGEVRGEIERMIVDGEIAAGEKMNELALSNVMGVSRGTVREAIRSLADSGLIDLITNRGAFVHEITLAEVRDLYDLRGAIFAMACASAARRVGEGSGSALPQKLLRNIEKMQNAYGNEDTERYYALNIEFHNMLIEGADNAKAKTVYDNLVREMHLFRRRGLSIVNNLGRSLQEHIVISDAVIAGDGEAARAAAHHHITSGFARYMHVLENEPKFTP